MRKLCGVLALGCLIGLGFSAPAKAQDTGKISLFAGYSFMTNNLGNSLDEGDCYYSCGSTGLSGYTGSVVYNFNNHIGFEANFDGHNGSPTIYSCTSPAGSSDCDEDEDSYTEKVREDIYLYTFGPKFTVPVGNFALFAHALVGGAHVHEGYSDTYCYTEGGGDPCYVDYSGQAVGSGFAFKTGGGLDWNHKHWGIRILEADYVRINADVTEHDDGYDEVYKYRVNANNFELSTGVTLNFK